MSMWTVHLTRGRGVLDAQADDIRVQDGALLLSRAGTPVAVLAPGVWSALFPADADLMPAEPETPTPAAAPRPGRRVLPAANVPDTVRR